MVSRSYGHHVFVSSPHGQISLPTCAGFSASQHALQAFADSLRAETAADGIRVTVASLGAVGGNGGGNRCSNLLIGTR